ncbi:CHAP domain-containing protein, partial [Leekyejoonella antrihumi]
MSTRSQSSIARRTAISLIGTLILVASLLGWSAPRAFATGPGCTAFAGAYALGASYNDGSISIQACGPKPGTGSGPNVYPYPGARPVGGYQCMELSERYLYYKYGVTMPISTNGAQVVDHYASSYPSLFRVYGNGAAGHAPVQGDVLSFSNTGGFSDYGHTAVVQSSSVNGSGNGSITVIEENSGWTANGAHVLTVANWIVRGEGFAYTKWLHGPGSATPSSPTGVVPASGVIPSGMYHFISYVGSNGTLYLAHWTGTRWQNDSFNYPVRAGTSPSAYLGPNGTHFISYVGSNGTLYLAHWTGTRWQNDSFNYPVRAGTSPSAYL